MGVVSLCILLWMMCVRLCVSQDVDRPDITMLFNRGFAQTCVAGSNTNGYGLILSANDQSDGSYVQDFETLDIYGNQIDSSDNCDFEDGSNFWRWSIDSDNIKKSGSDPLAPVIDERWNKLEIYRTDGEKGKAPKYGKIIEMPDKNDFIISFSIRGRENAQIVLCEKKTPKYSPCYWIIIDGFEQEAVTAIRKCTQGIPDSFAKEADCAMRRQNSTEYGKLLDPSKWVHFTLSKIHNQIRFWIWDLNKSSSLILDYIDEDPLDLKYISIRTYNTIIDWKIHEYKFLKILQQNELIIPRSNLNFATNTSLCISFYVAVCSSCIMDIFLEREDGVKVMQTTITGDPEDWFMKWKNVKLENGISKSDFYNYNLYVNLRTTFSQNQYTFWAIDDFRKCSKHEIRRKTTQYRNKLQCYSLNYQGWTIKPNDFTNNFEVPPVCSDGRYIGGFCNITLSAAVDVNDGYQICSPTQANEKGRCVCSAGFIWYSGVCTTSCALGYYGYQCKDKCGKCINSQCFKNTGNCENGCEPGYQPPMCQKVAPRFVFPPEVVKTFFTSVTIEMKNKTITGSSDGKYFQIECKMANDHSAWKVCSNQYDINYQEEISITGLEKESTYLIRAIIFIENGFSYRNINLPTTEITTTCKVDRDINVFAKSKSAVITFTTIGENCALRNYKAELRQNNAIIREVNSLEQNLELLNLIPFTHYELIITNQKNPSYIEKKYFRTEQDAPGVIKNLNLINATNTEIILSWAEPNEPNGIILKYSVSYKLIQRIGCVGNRIAHEDNITVYPKDISEVKISGLQPYSTYYIQIIAETILPGAGNGDYFDTLMTNVINNEELPKNIFTSELSSLSVIINWEVDCNKQQGPLLYQINIKCIDSEWCAVINDIVLNDINVVNKGVATYDLTPYTNYTCVLRAKRTENDELTTFNRTVNFSSLAGSPPAVKNFTAYSKDKESISVRWLYPYPPHGHLESFNLKYCTNTNDRSCKNTLIRIPDLKPCNLWAENFYCHTFTDLWTNYEYRVQIYAKNTESKVVGDNTENKVKTTEGVPSVPLNVTRLWENNIINLYWNHPNITNGRLKRFVITLQQNGTELTNQDTEAFYEYLYNITEEMKVYTYQIEKSFRYSSSYILTIYAVNSFFDGDKKTLYIDTPPETPELEENIKINNELTTNTTITLIIPEIKKNTKSKNSFLFVVVDKVANGISKRQAETNDDPKVYILSHSSAWIAIEIKLNENDLNNEVTLGTGETTFSEYLKEDLENKALEPSNDYEVTVVLMNLYREQRSIQFYQKNVRTSNTYVPSPSGGLYALLLLLLLPFVAFLVYRYGFKKEIKRTSMMMIPGLRVVRSEDQHDPDVIPLTEAASEPAQQSKPKKPVVAAKPGSSVVPTETSEPAEINNTATNFFHSRIILLENLENYLKEALENGDLEEQHALFPRGQTKPWNYGMLKPNKFKNRYNNLIAYDKNRVKLEKINSDQYSDYINASYINGYRQERAYIATQGSKLATVNDFWRMIWQEKVQYIVMLANVVEAGKKKCEKYWPEIDSSREYGNITVHFEKSEVYADYEYRTFDLTCKGEKRKITQLHFTSWPDHGVPLYPQSLVPFLKKMLTIRQSTAPIVVHCSAGVGRTGTIILCDICLRMAAREKAIDVLRYLHEIREQRANMVDNIDQYKLVHMVLLECLLAPDTNIPCNADLSTSIQKLIEEGGLQIQLNYLQQTSWQDIALNFASIKEPDPVNESKNRFNDIVPLENQVYISRFPIDDENSDYINAVPVDGFRFKEQFIVTQNPMPDTVKDFWRMVSEKSVKIIVCLNEIPNNDKTSCVFWPSENSEMKPVPNINLKYHKMQTCDYYDIHSIVLDDKSTQESKMIQLVQFTNWTHGNKLPQNEENLVMLWEEVENLSHGNYPMIITCYDGATASGLFVAMSFVIEKIKLEQQCDPCLAVRVVRRNRKQFVTNKTQFEFLYRSAVIYLSMFELYSNFQPVVNKQNN